MGARRGKAEGRSAVRSALRLLQQGQGPSEAAVLGRERGLGDGQAPGEGALQLACRERPGEAIADAGVPHDAACWDRPEGLLPESVVRAIKVLTDYVSVIR